MTVSGHRNVQGGHLDTPVTEPTFSKLSYVRESLEDAESLLQYASETGVAVDDATKKAVLDARAAFHKGLDEPIIADLLSALANLARLVLPVTPASLRISPKDNKDRKHHYRSWRYWASGLAVIIILFSTLSYVTSTIADSIRADIAIANPLAVKLTSEFPTNAPPTQPEIQFDKKKGCGQTKKPATKDAPVEESSGRTDGTGLSSRQADVVKDLQQYAGSIRDIDAQTRELNFYVHPFDRIFNPEKLDPFYWIRGCTEDLTNLFELPLPLSDYAQVAEDRTWTYQRVRYIGQHTADDVSFYYGAVSSSILPVLYALLGTFAYILQNYERRVNERSYVPSSADSARFVTSAIGGAVIGLFSNLILGAGIKVPPLALAFLIGYAVDAFYTFLETVIQSLTKSALGSNRGVGGSTQPPTP
jgi:hypothetical protein